MDDMVIVSDTLRCFGDVLHGEVYDVDRNVKKGSDGNICVPRIQYHKRLICLC